MLRTKKSAVALGAQIATWAPQSLREEHRRFGEEIARFERNAISESREMARDIYKALGQHAKSRRLMLEKLTTSQKMRSVWESLSKQGQRPSSHEIDFLRQCEQAFMYSRPSGTRKQMLAKAAKIAKLARELRSAITDSEVLPGGDCLYSFVPHDDLPVIGDIVPPIGYNYAYIWSNRALKALSPEGSRGTIVLPSHARLATVLDRLATARLRRQPR